MHDGDGRGSLGGVIGEPWGPGARLLLALYCVTVIAALAWAIYLLA